MCLITLVARFYGLTTPRAFVIEAAIFIEPLKSNIHNASPAICILSDS